MCAEFTGYRIEDEDREWLRSYATPMRLMADIDFAAPEEIDPRPWHRIENQGSMGSCQGHELSSVCEMAYRIATGKVTQFSQLYCYYGTQKIDGLLGRDVGSTIAGGLKLAMQYGVCPYEVMPYPNPVRYTGQIPEEAWPAAEPFKIRSHAYCRNYADVFNYLASGQGGVGIGISWGSGMQGAVIDRFYPGGGGHAVAFLGYSRRKDSQGRKYLWLANSWGQGWGNGGWTEVAPMAVDQMGAHQYTVMIGMSDLSVPRPRNVNWLENPVL